MGLVVALALSAATANERLTGVTRSPKYRTNMEKVSGCLYANEMGSSSPSLILW
jgi:hypothetical protein